MKKHLFTILLLLFGFASWAQQIETFLYAEKDTAKLYLDVYKPAIIKDNMPCVLYIFGGGFISGSRDEKQVKEYCESLAERGFVAVPIDYRLGLKGAKNVGLLNYKPVEHAIQIATEDAISALSYLVQNAESLNIDKSKIILIGSSAGAITALETDYYIANGKQGTSILPSDFRLAGVVSYSGAVFSHEGKVKYRIHEPAPTMMFHGTKDKLVTYRQMRLFKVGLYGPDKLVKRFNKQDYPYYFRRYEGYAHSVAGLFQNTIDEFMWFYNNFIVKDRKLQVDELFRDNQAIKPAYDDLRPDDLYK